MVGADWHPLGPEPLDVAHGGRLGDDDRTSALLILTSGVDPNLAAPATAWCSRATIRSLMIRPSEGGQEAGGLVSSHAIGP
jgi:hypothetical protein